MSINETSLANQSWINMLEPRKYVWFYLMFIFVILITIIGNTLVVLAVLKNRNLQNTTNYFLMSLAIADCLVALIVWPLSVITEILGYFPFGFVVCNFWVTSDILLCTSSIWHMCVMSIDRFCTIKFPLKYGRNKTRKFLFWKIATVWLISTAISSPMLVLGFVNESFVYVESSRSCSPNHSEFRLFGSILAFCIPFLIITVTYSFTMKALKRLMQKKEITRLIGDKDIDEENTLVVSAVASTVRNGSIFNHDSITPHDKLYGVRKSFRKFTPCSFRRASSQDRHRPSRVELLNNLNSPNSIRLCSMLDNQPALKSIKSDSKNHKYSIFSSMITTNSSIGESRHKIMIPSNIRDTNIELDFNQNNTFFPNNNHNVDKNDNHTKVNSLDKLFMSEQSETKVKCDNEPAIEQRNEDDDDEFGRLDHNTLHLSLPKLNFSMEKNKSDSNLNRSFKTRGRLFGAGSSAGSRRKNNYNLIFELNDSSVHRSNSSLVELTGFEKSKYRLKRMQKLKNALFGIEREMDKLLNVGAINDQQQAQSNVTVKPINNKKYPTKTTSPSASIISTTTPATRIKKSITTPKTMNKPIKQTKKAKKSQANANEKSKCQIKQNLVERRDTQRPSENIESNISSLICDGDSSSLLNFKWKIANIMFKSSRAESSQANGNGTRQQSPTKKATTYDTFVTRVSDDGKNAEFSPYKRESYRHILCKQISYPNSKTSSDCILRNSSFFVSGSNYIKNVPRLALKSNKANNERKALRVLIIIFSIFVLFWSPFFVVNLVSIYCVEMCKFITNELILAITWLGYASSTLNPIIYTMFNKSFRNAFINLLKCRTIPQKELRRDRFLVYKNTAAYSHLNKNIKS